MSALVDLPLIINVSEPILAARRIRSLTEFLPLDLPALTAGANLAGELRLCDSAGAIIDESGAVAEAPVLLISRFSDNGQEALALVTSFTRITADPKGWSFVLDLNTEPLVAYLGDDGEPKQAVFEISLAGTSRLRSVYRRTVTLLPPLATGESAVPVALLTPILRPDLTSAALHRAVVTVGKARPTLYLTLEDGMWNAWTLRTRVDGEVDDGTTYRLPNDHNASTNNVIWVKSAIS